MFNIKILKKLTLPTFLFLCINCFAKTDENKKSFEKLRSEKIFNKAYQNGATEKKGTDLLHAIIAYKEKLHDQLYTHLEL